MKLEDTQEIDQEEIQIQTVMLSLNYKLQLSFW